MIQDGKSVTNCADQRVDSDPVKRRDLAPSPDSYREVCKASRRGSTDRSGTKSLPLRVLKLKKNSLTYLKVKRTRMVSSNLLWIHSQQKRNTSAHKEPPLDNPQQEQLKWISASAGT